MQLPARIEFEKYMDKHLERGICPTCNAKIGHSLNVLTGERLYVCYKCGWTKMRNK